MQAHSHSSGFPVSKRTFAAFLKGRTIKAFLFIACSGFLAYPIMLLLFDPLALGANPAEWMIRQWGDQALQILLLTLLISPLRMITHLNEWLRLRRMLGLFAFTALCLHVMAYVAFDRLFVLADIWTDLIKRPFITFGMIGFLMLLALAVTSSRMMVLRLGGDQWLRLHRLIYPASLLAILHYWLMVKRDISQPLLYACLLGVLLIVRLPVCQGWLKKSISNQIKAA